MPPTTNYSRHLGDLEPLATIRRNVERMLAVTGGWTPQHFERSLAPGKWTARLIVTHLAHTELALGTRARMALSTPNYTAQSFDQDLWLARDTRLTGTEAVETFAAIARFNVSLFEGLSPADRQIGMTHPEYGTITVEWIVHLLAGHQIHHLLQLEQIGTGSR
jgi:hypothetical protein